MPQQQNGVILRTTLALTRVAADENLALSGRFDLAEKYSVLALGRQCCQRLQRLLKTLHRDDPQATRVALRVAGVVPIDRHEEDVDVRFSRSDRLLLDAADPGHRSVELDLTGGCDLVAVIDVASFLLQKLERER